MTEPLIFSFPSSILFVDYFSLSLLKMKTRCLITSGHIINSNMFLMNEFDIIIMQDWLLVFISLYFLHVWLFSWISSAFRKVQLKQR